MAENQLSSEYAFRFKDGLLGAQMLFVAFGALVLVPILTGLDPNVALFTAGAGTLIFQVVTRDTLRNTLISTSSPRSRQEKRGRVSPFSPR